MKKILISALLFVCFATNIHSQEKDSIANMDLYLLIGQSNMAGRGQLDKENTSTQGIYSLNKDNRWDLAADPLHFDKKEAGVGPGIYFAKAIKEKNPQKAIGLIPCAVGGTSISKWLPAEHDSATNTYPYDNTVKRLKIALKNGRLKGILWHQGESDSDDGKYKNYEKKFNSVLCNLSKDLNINLNTIPIIIGELGEFLKQNNKTPESEEINNVLHQIANKHSTIYCVTSAGLTDKGDKLHFDTHSAIELGKRYAQAYELILNKINASSSMPLNTD